MDIITTSTKMAEYIINLKKQKCKISYVPTMGDLHDGHISLIQSAKKEKSKTIVSIFVNPLQFNDKSDYQSYPTTTEKDLEKLIVNNVDCLFLPAKDNILNNLEEYKINKLPDFLNCLCGKFRPNHFEGVYTIVRKLFDLVNPDYVYFGEKDYQQALLIKYIIKNSYNNKINLIVCETIRDEFGLAMSSRNNRLSNQQKKIASNIIKELMKIRTKIHSEGISLFNDLREEAIKVLEEFGMRVEYLELLTSEKLDKSEDKNNNYMIFIAVYLSDVRLIDNLKI